MAEFGAGIADGIKRDFIHTVTYIEYTDKQNENGHQVQGKNEIPLQVKIVPLENKKFMILEKEGDELREWLIFYSTTQPFKGGNKIKTDDGRLFTIRQPSQRPYTNPQYYKAIAVNVE